MKLNPYGAFPGVKDALSLLDLLSDEERLKDVRRLLQQLEQQRIEHNKIVDEYKIAGDIRKELGKAKSDRAAAEKMLKDAEEKINAERSAFADFVRHEKELIGKRNGSVSARETNLKKQVDKVNKQITETQAEMNKKAAELGERDKELAEREKLLRQQEKRITQIELAIQGE